MDKKELEINMKHLTYLTTIEGDVDQMIRLTILRLLPDLDREKTFDALYSSSVDFDYARNDIHKKMDGLINLLTDIKKECMKNWES